MVIHNLTMMNNIKIAIADDHPLITEGIQNMLRYDEAMEVTVIYHDGAELLEGLKVVQPDILLLDINMPGMQGDSLARIISRQYPAIKIIALTNLDNIYFIKSMLQNGASGYVLKNISKKRLLTALQTVYDGGTFLDDAVQEKIAEEQANIKKQTAYGNTLTRREKEVLKLIAENNTSKEIGEKLHLSKRTIDHHRESLLSKMEVKNVAALVKKATELGLIQT